MCWLLLLVWSPSVRLAWRQTVSAIHEYIPNKDKKEASTPFVSLKMVIKASFAPSYSNMD